MTLRQLHLSALLLGLALTSNAGIFDDFKKGDDPEPVKKEIAKIKKNTDKYLYGEATCETEAEARQLAEEILTAEINAWAATQDELKGNASFVIKKINDFSEAVTLPRGNMHRAFLFVEKDDIIAGDYAAIIDNSAPAPAQLPAPETPKLEAPTAGTPQYPAAVLELAKQTTFDAFKAKLQQLKNEKKVAHFGGYASLGNPDIYYLAIYDRSYKMVATLSPGPNRVNIATGKPDGTENYKGCGAVGFSIVK